MRHRTTCGFTLVEILIVVVILGILAAIAIPQFSARRAMRDTSAQTTLQYLRGQVELFKAQHGSIPPQEGCMWTLMQDQSNTMETAVTNPTGNVYGPYFHGTPLNPWNGLTTVSTAVVDTTAGWYYTADITSYELRLRNTDGSVNTVY